MEGLGNFSAVRRAEKNIKKIRTKSVHLAPIKVKAKIIGTVLRPISLSGPLMMQTKDIYSAKCFNDIHERCVRVVRDYSSVYVDLKLKRSPKITAKKTNIGSTVKHKLAFYIKNTKNINFSYIFSNNACPI